MPETYGDSPIHPIIEHPHQFEIVRLDYCCGGESRLGTHLDLTLKRAETVRRLRFLMPRRLKVEEGFPQSTGGMVILDIRHRQWEGLGVEVADFEASHGSVTFVAADVVDLDELALTSGCS